MGACFFITPSTGKTMEEAYDRAVDHAVWEYGHDTYNGTISTTRGVIDVTDILKGLPLVAKRKVIDAVVAWNLEDYHAKNLSTPQRERAKKLQARVGSVRKWGPCVGWKQAPGKYYFAGWAAE